MVQYVQHLRLTASGTLGPASAPVEIFSYRLNLSDPVAGTVTLQTLLDGWHPMVSAFHGSAEMQIWSGCVLREVKLARIGPDGLYTEDAAKQAVTTAGGSVSAAPNNPFQQALVVSLSSDKRGPRGRGRMYLPVTGHGSNENGLIAEADRDAAQTRAAAFIQALNDNPATVPPEPRVTIASTGGKSLTPANYDVTGVRVGRVLDVIRSRRNKLAETYDPITAITS